jgi:hypothetical protein
VTLVPAADADAVADAMVAAGAGRIGRYAGCSFRSQGEGTFLPKAGATPVAGAVGEFSRGPETKVEMTAPQAAVPGIVAALVAAHPYEEPAYDVSEVKANAGFVGRAGSLARPMSLEALAAQVGDRVGGIIRVAGRPTSLVSRVAVVPGSGGDFIAAAADHADVLVTGDISHHQARGAVDRGLALIDPGHAATERPGIATLYAAVAQMAAEVVNLTHLDPSPWEEL